MDSFPSTCGSTSRVQIVWSMPHEKPQRLFDGLLKLKDQRPPVLFVHDSADTKETWKCNDFLWVADRPRFGAVSHSHEGMTGHGCIYRCEESVLAQLHGASRRGLRKPCYASRPHDMSVLTIIMANRPQVQGQIWPTRWRKSESVWGGGVHRKSRSIVHTWIRSVRLPAATQQPTGST